MAQQLAHSQQLKNPKYRNWVKAGLGLKYLKEGLETFSDDVIDQQHTDIINVVQKKHNLPMVNCGQCNLRTLQPDHVRNKNKQCPLGQNNCNCMFPGGKITCPNNVCGAIHDEIIINHASNPPAPNWKNTDVQNWCTDAWAVAKCYINAPGYATKRNAKEIDCTGLLHLYINSKFLQGKIQCKITGQDVFTKTRSARNTIYHSNSMEMEDIEVDEHIDNMIAVLEDGKELLHRQESQDAVIKLKELKNSSIVISAQDEALVIKEAYIELDQRINDLNETIQKGKEAITQKEKEALQAVQKIKEQLENREKEVLDNILKHEAETCAVIKNRGKDAIENITASVKQLEDSAYTQAKKDFQKSLVEMYLENVVKVSPVLLQPERTDTVISQLYVDPYLEIEPREKDNTQEKTKVSSYTEIFEKDGKPLKLIYLIGEAGSGKSTFCIDMIHKWCLAHSEQRTQESENVQFMKKFKYLFYIYLRHNMDADRIETMIRNHYENDVLEPILTKESGDCLILLDGLDEWTATEQQRTVSQFQTKGLPIRDLRKKYTVITTSRPWKFESLSIKSTENNQTLRLRGVFDVDEMARKTVHELNEMFRTSKTKADFDKDFSKCSFEDDMKRMPMVIQQLVCLWFDGKLKQFGKSEIYSNMISLYFEWADRRNPDDHVLKNLKEKSILSRDVILPNQCIRTELCEEHKYVIHHVGRLAYKTLFSEEKELSLSFNNSTFQRYKIPEEVIQCCLVVGLLTKEHEIGLSLSRRKHVSFSFVHKSVQEFFAAIFLYVEIKQRSPQMFKMYTIDTIDDNIKCLQDFLGSCKTVADILVQSNVISYLCGFDTYLAAHVSRFLFNISHEDDMFIAFRENVMYDPFERHTFLCGRPVFPLDQRTFFLNPRSHINANILGMQDLILSCIKEATIPEGKAEQLYFLADIAYESLSYTDIKNKEMIKYVKAEYVSFMSLHLSGIPIFLFDILNDPAIGRHLSTLKIFCSGPVMGEGKKILLKLFVKSEVTLKCLFLKSLPEIYGIGPMYSFFQDVVKMLPNLKNLLSLRLESITLLYSDIFMLCSFLTGATYLRQIFLRHVTYYPIQDVLYQKSCEINLSKHCQLQFWSHDYCPIRRVYLDAFYLETCANCLPYFDKRH